MEAKTIRAQLDEVRTALTRNEDEHEILVSLIRGYEGWLRLNPEPAAQLALVLRPPPKAGKGSSQQKGTVSFRSSVLRVLRDARGEPLHSREILARAQALGAVTEAKNPVGTADLMAYSLSRSQPLRRSSPRTWRWVGDEEGQ